LGVVTAELLMMLARLERLNEAFVSESCRRHGLTASELRVLGILRYGPAPASPTSIRRLIVQTSGGLTATMARLERAALVERVPDPADGRGRLVQLTTAGTEVQQAVFDELVDRYSAAFAEVDVEAALPVVRTLVTALEGPTSAAPSGHWGLDHEGAPDGARA
jgi:DNA-binding MarR family transcriptional regulator